MNSIHVETKIGESVDIPLYDKITVITGDSSSGKTKMLNWLKACKHLQKEVVTSSINLNDTRFVVDYEDVTYILNENCTNKYIFIDHYSFVESTKLYEFIIQSKNIFIIMGHRNTSGLTSQDAVLALNHDGKHYTCEQVYKNGLFKPLELI